MDFNQFPAQWEWVALILGGVALIMAIPPLIQMKWGAPKIHLSFEIDEEVEFRYLVCEIYNEPITRGILYHLGVRREIANDVRAEFEVFDANTNKLICPISISDIKTQAGVSAERISLPASILPASFVIAFAAKGFPGVGCANEPSTYLPIGYYKAKIGILSSNTIYKTERVFRVIDKYPFVYWETKT
jgi:hypothetical protein